jgi:YegS/Rv2252/BmrU family lipid kinase
LRRFALIVNPVAAGGRTLRALPHVQAALGGHGIAHRTQTTRSLEHAAELARAARQAGEVAVAFGGDGLVGAVAGALAHTDGVLGVLPGGRGNDFARGLGIPLSPRAACEVLRSGPVRRLDLARAGSRTFVGIASCGLDSDANRIANQARFVRGKLVYVYGALRALVGWTPAEFTLSLDDGAEARTVIGYSVAAANSRAYGGGMLLAPDASLEDGRLDVVIISDMAKLRLLRLLPTVFSGAHVRERGVEVLHARRLMLSADRPFTLYADGDPLGELPVTVTALPAAIQVIAPR